MFSYLLSRDPVAFNLHAWWESRTLTLLMESNRCGQTMEESSDVVEVIVIPDDPPSSQDITVPSVSSTLSSCSSSSASRVTENSQSLAVHFDSRTDPTDCHMTSGVNKPPQLPMDNRRETQTAGESTVNTSTAIFRPSNVPAFPSSRAPSTLTQSTYPMPRGSAASLPANVVRILLLHVIFWHQII